MRRIKRKQPDIVPIGDTSLADLPDDTQETLRNIASDIDAVHVQLTQLETRSEPSIHLIYDGRTDTHTVKIKPVTMSSTDGYTVTYDSQYELTKRPSLPDHAIDVLDDAVETAADAMRAVYRDDQPPASATEA